MPIDLAQASDDTFKNSLIPILRGKMVSLTKKQARAAIRQMLKNMREWADERIALGQNLLNEEEKLRNYFTAKGILTKS
jgi:hypothetical protein